jgi:hypothetical protein
MTTQLTTVFGNVNCYSSIEDCTTFDVFGQPGLELLAVNGCNDGPYFEPTEGTEYGKWDKLNDKCIKVAGCNLYTFVDNLDDENGSLSIDSTDTELPHNSGAWSAWVIPAGSGPELYLRVKDELRKIKLAAKAAKKERTFQDLDADAQRRAIDDYRENLRQSDELYALESTAELAMEELDNQFLEVSDLRYQGFWSQGDGASFAYETSEELWEAWVYLQGYSDRELFCLLGWGGASVSGVRSSSHHDHELSIRADLDISQFGYLDNRGYDRIFEFISKEADKFHVAVASIATELMQEIYQALESEYEYQMSADCIADYLQNCGDFFTKKGNMK